MGLALIMRWALVGRGAVRTAILVPYGIVTVVAAYSWRYAWTPGTEYLANLLPSGSAPLTRQWPATFIIIAAEIWKTTPFMALLLLAGLALVPEELLKAAKVDGAGAWQHFTRIILPLMKPAILVALLFRTLDAFEIFDNIFILTARRRQHPLGVDPRLRQPVHRAQPGHRLRHLGARLRRGGRHRLRLRQGLRHGRARPGGPPTSTRTVAGKASWGVGNTIVILAALVPVLWLASLSFKDPSTIADGKLPAPEVDAGQLRGIFQTSLFTQALVNSIGIALIATVLVVVGSMAAYAVARLRFPGKQVLVAVTLLIAMFLAISLVSPLFNLWRQLGLFDTWPGLIIPYLTFSLPLAIYTLSAFFARSPWELERAAQVDGAHPFQAFRQVIAPLAAPGMVTTAILVFIFCWTDFVFAISLTSTSASQTVPAAIAFFSGASQFETPIGSIAAAGIVITIPIILFVFFQRRIVAGLTSGAVKEQGADHGRDHPGPCQQAVPRRHGGRQRRQPRHRRRRVHHPRRPLRLREVDLANMIAGLEDITEGELRIGGQVISQLAPTDPRHRPGVPDLRPVPAR